MKTPEGNWQNVELILVGDAELVVHRWSEEAKKQLIGYHRPPQSPDEQYEEARFKLPNGADGIPAIAFKNAVLTTISKQLCDPG